MNKKLIFFSLVILISMSFVFAYSLTDVLSGRVSLVDLILGRTIYSTGNECIDSDGSDYYNQGETHSEESNRTFDYRDLCITDNILREYYCTSTGEASAKQYTCSKGCEKGACKISAPSTTKNICIDSDGSDYYNQGETHSEESNRTFDYRDLCITDNILREYYCTSTGEASAKQYTCSNGCGNGACKTLTCIDSDGGQNFFAKGTLYSDYNNFGMVSDFCVYETPQTGEHPTYECLSTNCSLTEYYCDNMNIPKYMAYSCPYGCKNGTCQNFLSPIICYDSDNGTNYYERGSSPYRDMYGNDWDNYTTDWCSTNFGNGGKTSSCNGINCSLVEYTYCSDSYLYANLYNCPYGCSEGACIQQPTNQCTDSDNSRYDYNTKGTTTSTESGNNYIRTDECITSNILREYYCTSNGEASADAYTCPDSCLEGACLTKEDVIGEYSGFYGFPKKFFDYSNITKEQVVKITDAQYLTLKQMHNEIAPYDFTKIEYQSEIYGTTTPYGIKIGDSAFPNFNSGNHRWEVIAHEQGHNFFGGTSKFYGELAFPYPFLQESLAVLSAFYTYYTILENSYYYGIDSVTIESLNFDFLNGRNYQKMMYEEYVNEGSNFNINDILTSQALDYKMIIYGENYGWGNYKKVAKAFEDEIAENFTFQNDNVSATEQATYLVASLSVAFANDFRSEFKELNFPINDSLYEEFYTNILKYVGDQTCIDSDGSSDPYTYGEVSYDNETYKDNCYYLLWLSWVNENYCEEDVRKEDKIYCSGGCISGECNSYFFWKSNETNETS